MHCYSSLKEVEVRSRDTKLTYKTQTFSIPALFGGAYIRSELLPLLRKAALGKHNMMLDFIDEMNNGN